MQERTPFNFKKSLDKLYSYHYVSGKHYDSPTLEVGTPYVEQMVVSKNWPGLFNQELNPANLPWKQFNLYGDVLEENVVYLGLIWRMLQEAGLECYAIGGYHSQEEAAKLLQKPFEHIAWQYEVLAYEPDTLKDKGFKSVMPSLKPRVLPALPQSPAERSIALFNPIFLFRIESFSELVNLQKATLDDATSEITLFGVKAERNSALVTFLRSKSPPDLTAFLESGEFFIDLLLGIDMFYCDSLLIKSQTDITGYLEQLVTEYERSIDRFEEKVATISDVNTYLQTLELLAQGRL